MMYSNLEMLYAQHVLEGKRTIDKVPEVIRPAVAEIVTNAKKQDSAESAD